MISDAEFDFAVIGGGIVGLATAVELLRRAPSSRLILLEKEHGFALGQTGRNSGVIHAGVYYKPGSLKARLCRAGAQDTKLFCLERGIAFEQCGKLIVATTPLELSRLADLAERARANGIEFSELDARQLAIAEPAVTGLGALLVPATGIVDYAVIARALADDLRDRGGVTMTRANVTHIAEDERGVSLTAGNVTVRAARLVACAGLQSDRLARLAGLAPHHRIIPFRGEYYTLPDRLNGIVNHLIYPVPDPDLPFLGIHLTRTITGGVTVGPNAVLGFAREGYARGSVDRRDLAQMLAFPGFWRLVAGNWRHGLGEFRNSLSRAVYLEQCRKYCPSLTLADLAGPVSAGIRAQAVMPDGTVVDDFLFLQSDRMLHVCNAPSPAATSAMPIARMIVERVMAEIDA
jgi:L-2-hydroxyglutarate oxidase